jgi:hypothetical protein
VFKASNKGVTAPRVLYKVDPEYTKEARDAKIESTVVLRLEVYPYGRAHNTRIERPLDAQSRSPCDRSDISMEV